MGIKNTVNDNSLSSNIKMKSGSYSEISETGSTIVILPIEQDEDDEDNSKMCCLSRCLMGIVAGFLFIIVVPLGFLFVVYGQNHDSLFYLVIGIFFLALPVIVFVTFVIFVQIRNEIRSARESQKAESLKQNNQSPTSWEFTWLCVEKRSYRKIIIFNTFPLISSYSVNISVDNHNNNKNRIHTQDIKTTYQSLEKMQLTKIPKMGRI